MYYKHRYNLIRFDLSTSGTAYKLFIKSLYDYVIVKEVTVSDVTVRSYFIAAKDLETSWSNRASLTYSTDIKGRKLLNEGQDWLLAAGKGGAYEYLLDNYSGANAAYSLRLLSSSYSGDAIVVRRSSDNATQNIGFIENELDVDTLETFCSGTDGFVARWFDQSGNSNDARSVIASEQPRIVLNGAAIKYNNKVVLDYNASERLAFVDSLNNNIDIQYGTAFIVSKINTLSLVNYILHIFSPLNGVGFGGTSSGVDGAFIFDGAIKSLSGEDLNQHLGYFNDDGINHQIAIDGNSSTTFSRTLQLQAATIGVSSAVTNALSYVSEIIMYTTNQSSNKAGIENNINNYYNIY